jgi:hypothetical protein
MVLARVEREGGALGAGKVEMGCSPTTGEKFSDSYLPKTQAPPLLI